MTPNDENYSPFGTLAISVLLVLGGGLWLIRELSALIGMPW